MNGTIKNLFIFVTGVAVGSVATWKLIENKYEQLVQEEIASVKEVFSRREVKLEETHERLSENAENKKKPLNDGYKRLVKDLDYSSYSERKEEKPMVIDRPYVIPPEEAGMLEGYDIISLKYYDDGVLVDENNELVDEVDEAVGLDSLQTFGQYEDDAVYVRNDKRKCDFEILRELGEYSNVRTTKPHSTED